MKNLSQAYFASAGSFRLLANDIRKHPDIIAWIVEPGHIEVEVEAGGSGFSCIYVSSDLRLHGDRSITEKRGSTVTIEGEGVLEVVLYRSSMLRDDVDRIVKYLAARYAIARAELQ